MDIDVGQVIAGKYELVRLLGRGAMAEVWVARHTSLGGEFAIKLIAPTAEDVAGAAARFQLEAQIAATLSRRTRHIVSVIDHGEEKGLPYLVMELLEGESLESRLKRGPLTMPEAVAIVSQVARALALAHVEGILHRDLKPANVWLGRDEDGRLLVKLLDFGIARALKPFRTRSPLATGKDLVLGTPTYMSPEQARGLENLDHRCDVWALAVVAYEALCNKLPFDGATVEDVFLAICTFKLVPIRSREPALPASLDAFFARAFAPGIVDRFQGSAELAVEFEKLIDPDELDESLGFAPAPSSRRTHAAAPPSASRLEAAGALLPPRKGRVRAGGGAVRKIGASVRFGAVVAMVGALAIAAFFFGGGRRRENAATASAAEDTTVSAPLPPASTEARGALPRSAPTPSTAPPTPASAAPSAAPRAASKPRTATKPAASSMNVANVTTPAPSASAQVLPSKPVDKSEVF